MTSHQLTLDAVGVPPGLLEALQAAGIDGTVEVVGVVQVRHFVTLVVHYTPLKGRHRRYAAIHRPSLDDAIAHLVNRLTQDNNVIHARSQP